MNLTLHFCWKEWRAQRPLLTAYTLLVLACLCLGFLLAPEHFWLQEGNRAHVLGWFVMGGVIGVVAFAAPQLVRGEFTARDDGFVRRLPGALAPAFGGKLLFLLLAGLAMPLLGLCVGELFLQATGHQWDDLFVAIDRRDGSYASGIRWPAVATYLGLGLVALPWVWVLAMWLPNGRMATGGVALLALLLGIGVAAVLHPCPGLEKTIGGEAWLWPVWPAALGIGALSWVRGRRGGGSGRSARIGLAAFGVALLPPALWLGTQVHEYRNPDLAQLARLEVSGLSPDQRFVLGRGTSHAEWATVPLRIDLATGAAEQIGSLMEVFDDAVLRPYSPMWFSGQQRYWQWVKVDEPQVRGVFDIVTGEKRALPYDADAQQVVLPADLQATIEAQVRATTRLRAPGGVRFWVTGSAMHFEDAHGDVLRTAWPGEAGRSGLVPCGHGVRVNGDRFFDLTRRSFVQLPARTDARAIAVGGTWIFELQSRPAGEWMRQEPGAAAEPLPELKNCSWLGLLDDERLLCVRYSGAPPRSGAGPQGRIAGLFAYRVADRTMTPLQVPIDLAPTRMVWSPLPFGSLLGRDPRGRVWLACGQAGERFALLAIDPTTLQVERPLGQQAGDTIGWSRTLAFEGEHSILVLHGAQILRVALDTGAETVLFPREVKR